MIRLGICNELFDGWDFAEVCRTVKSLGYEGLEIAPFTLAPRITDLDAGRRRELRRIVEDAGLETIGLHWLLAKLKGIHLTSPEPGRAHQDRRLSDRACRGHARPGRLPHGPWLAHAARRAAGGQPRAGDGVCDRGLPTRDAGHRRDRASTSASSRWPPATRTSSTRAPRRWW